MGYRNVGYGKKSSRRNYSRMRYDIDLPNLIEIQTKSFDWFLREGIKELLQDVSPIEAHNGDMKLYFEEHELSEPKFSVLDSKKRDVNYSKQLSVKVKLENVITGEVRDTKVLMTDIPVMTPTGTFVINGAERVVVSQIIRSAGAYYTGELDKKVNRTKFSAQIIPTRGAWLEIEMGSKDILYSKLDRSKKVPLTTMMRALGIGKKKDIFEVFGKSDHLEATFEKDETKNSDDAVVELYSKLRQGERVPADAAREFIRMRLFDRRRYDLAAVGRYKYNKKLDVVDRIFGMYLVNDLVDPKTKKVLLKKDTIIDHDAAEILRKNRHLFRKEIIEKSISLQNESPSEILATRESEKSDVLRTSENIINLRSGEVIVQKNTPVDEEMLMILRKNRQSLDEKVIKFFLGKDVYQKEKERIGVVVETLDVKVKADEKEKTKIIRVVGNDQRETKRHITVSDIVSSLSYYLNLYDGIGHTDDIDHLGNRRLRLIGELLKNQFRIGLARAEKNIKDKMSITVFQEATPAQIINMTPLAGAIKTFFGSSQLSQFMDQINPLAELTQKRRVSALGTGGLARDRAGVEVRDVHNSHYGRICPIETPEGPSIGLISSLASYGRVDQYGFIQTPYLKVSKEGSKISVSSDYQYLTADEEYNEVIASAATKLDDKGYIIEEKVIGRNRGETAMFEPQQVSFMDVSPKQIVSVATSTIPFLEHDDASRALMGANMQRQAVPLLIPDSPIVGTGVEYRAAKDSGSVVVAKNSGWVTYVDSKNIVITSEPSLILKKGRSKIYDPSKNDFSFEVAKEIYEKFSTESTKYKLIRFFRSNQDTAIIQKPIVSVGEFVEKGDTIADGPSTKNGELALGRNVNIAFMTWEGYNYEDAIIMSEELVKDDVYTSVHINEYEIETRELKTGSGKEEFTREVPNVSIDSLRNLDERGIIVPGSEVTEGDILVGKITPKGMFEPSPSEKLIHAVIGEKSREYRDSSLRVPHGGGGIVQSVQILTKKDGVLPSGVTENIRVYVAKKRKITEGDKMAGRHGNKGVISRILPKEDMPYMEDGTPIDIMLNPLGVPSRMNIGQVLEIHLGLAAKKLGVKIATPVFDGVDDKDLVSIMKEAKIDIDGKTTLYDGRTGQPYENRISVGVMYMIKLSHMVDDKLHARSVGPYTLVTQQPMGGKAQNGGQRFGEMEVWALYAYGAAHTLQEMLTVKSDDMLGRNKVYSAITHDRQIPSSSIPESFRVLTKELQALGLYVELVDSKTGENEAVKSLVDLSGNRSRGGNR